MESTAAIIVLYNPSETILKIYEQIALQVDQVIYIDNSDTKPQCIDALINRDKTVYHAMNGNEGLARGLRKGCEIAIRMGYRYALLLDQDTSIGEQTMVEKMSLLFQDKDVGLVCPNIKNYYYQDEKRILDDRAWYPQTVEDTAFAITSGSLIDLDIYSQLGGFDEHLFIMLIDQDYCANLMSHGYRIVRHGEVYIYQEFGYTKQHKFLNKTARDPNYSPRRYWYLFRNERYCRLKWKEQYAAQKVNLMKNYLIVALYGTSKLRKTQACISGWMAGKRMYKEVSSQ